MVILGVLGRVLAALSIREPVVETVLIQRLDPIVTATLVIEHVTVARIPDQLPVILSRRLQMVLCVKSVVIVELPPIRPIPGKQATI